MPPQKEDLIYNQYFDYTEKYQKIYGQNTIVLMQVGSFFEVYGDKHTKTGQITKSRIELFKSTCNLMIAEKSCQTPSGILVMAGFRDYVLDKYLEKMTANGITVVVFVQKKDVANGGKIVREFAGVYSPGTYLPYESEQNATTLSNNLMCIWLETATIRNTKHMICGMANAHIFTGQTSIFEYETPFLLNTTTFDELERYISVYNPSEIILISTFNESTTQKIVNELVGIKPQVLHIVYLNESNNKNEISKKENLPTNPNQTQVLENCQNQVYIQHILSSLFGTESFQLCQEFSTYTIATQAFVYLVHFLKEHSPDMAKRLAIPMFKNTSTRMVLANHTLKQLNVLEDLSEDGQKMGRLSSIYTWLNRCCSPMGKRAYHAQITSPTFDENWLNKEYEMTAQFLENVPTESFDRLRQSLRKICDMEKIMRQLILRKVYPQTFYSFYKTLCEVGQLLRDPFCCIDTAADYLFGEKEADDDDDIKILQKNTQENLEKCRRFIETTLNIEKCAQIASMTSFDHNIISVGISPKLDAIFTEYGESLATFHQVHRYFNEILGETDFVKIHETEKMGFSLIITKKRGQQLMVVLEKMKTKTLDIADNFIIPVKDVRLCKSTASNEEIDFPQLKRLIESIQKCKDRMSEEIAAAYLDFLATFEHDWFNPCQSFVKFVAKLDVLQCKAYVAKKYNYCKPVIDDSAPHSYFDFVGLRHVLIEHIQTNEIYVTNDLVMSSQSSLTKIVPTGITQVPTGILLYGTNAVGKTSFIRAIGIAIIMAQAGFYVPCSKFRYKPYTAIFTRILGNDNLFKNLSTFAVEMSELRVILNMADENSLILGDELCSGTETESALSIFSAGLVTLHERKSTFLFATHFHEIAKWDEIRALECLQMKHMSVHYDRERDCLVYDRKLKDGAGNRMYGLEVCKSLYLDAEFLEMAYGFRNQYFEGQSELAVAKTSAYNTKKLRGMCEMCKEVMGEETHHLSPQKDADSEGFIGTFHKNHPANLSSLCSRCHDKIHSDEKKEKNEQKEEKNEEKKKSKKIVKTKK
jgi:DNA mismatch repair protein MutS